MHITVAILITIAVLSLLYSPAKVLTVIFLLLLIYLHPFISLLTLAALTWSLHLALPIIATLVIWSYILWFLGWGIVPQFNKKQPVNYLGKDNPTMKGKKKMCHINKDFELLYMAEVVINKKNITLKNERVICPNYSRNIEKNWSMWSHNQKLYFLIIYYQ